MNILLVHNFYQQYGGEETYIKALTRLLKEKGHKVVLYSKNSADIASLKDKAAAGAGLFRNRKVTAELSALIRTSKPDFALFQNVFPLISPSAYRICARLRVPVIQRVSNYRLMCPNGQLFRDSHICEECVGRKFAFPAVYHGCYHKSRLSSLFLSASLLIHRSVMKSFDSVSAFLFPSEFIRSYYVDHGYLPRQKTAVIPTFGPGPEQNGAAGRKQYFAYVGRLSEEKGIIPLLELFAGLPQKRLVVVGKDPSGKLQQRFRSYANIEFKGFLNRPEILNLISQAQAVIMPSLWYDVLPNVLIESYSVKTPVIAPRIGVFREAVKDGLTGRHYEYGNPDSLKNILSGYRITKRMTDGTENFYRNNFLPDTHYGALMKLYEKIRRN